MDMLFEWDEAKAISNQKKHGVTFQEGTTIFHDPYVATLPDPDHSDEEERYVSIGISVKHRILIVAHTERGTRTRIMSCRKAIGTERSIYEENKN